MRYGYFDVPNKEYVIERPDTPVPWMNYLHNDEYCALISNNGGGYSFHLSARDKRILRYRLNNIPVDRPGRYIYIRDEKTKDFWSATWQPVLKDLSEYKTETRHGFGYTRVTSNYKGVESDTLYVVPVDDNLELWNISLKNRTSSPKTLTLTSYAELCLFFAQNDMINFQYTYNIAKAYEKNNIIHHTTMIESAGHYAFFSADKKFSSFDCDREEFMGLYHSEANPKAVLAGKCSGSTADGGNPVAATSMQITLKPGETKSITYILGVAASPAASAKLVAKYRKAGMVDKVMKDLKAHWSKKLDSLQVKTPDKDINLSLNQWNAYQVHTTFSMSRGPSIYEGGIGRGMGFRDSNQDVLSVIHSVPGKVKKLITDLAKNMFKDGTAYHQFFRLTGEGDGKGYSDDPLWIILSTTAYVKETGDFKFLNEKVKWADGGTATMYEHLRAPLDYTYKNVGAHKIPCMGFADWNDTLHINGPKPGESVWVAEFLVKCARDFVELAEALGKTADAKKYRKMADDVTARTNKVCWDGNWYAMAFDGWGTMLGSKKQKDGKIYLNTQTWAVISGVADEKRGPQCMDGVKEHLDSKYGVALMYPGFKHFSPRLGGVSTFPPGLKENGGIFSHANPWAVIAETKLGRADIAMKYYKQILPPTKDQIQDIHRAEPYIYAQAIASREHRDFGFARNSWLTGAASWNYVAATQYILGVRPSYHGLEIDPCVPKDWNQYEVTRDFRGASYHITVKNPKHVSRGVQSITVNGKRIAGKVIPAQRAKGQHEVEVILG
ncbi:MAG: GH36-type glycosyl hydrolase domain-containing protein [bacterium]